MLQYRHRHTIPGRSFRILCTWGFLLAAAALSRQPLQAAAVNDVFNLYIFDPTTGGYVQGDIDFNGISISNDSEVPLTFNDGFDGEPSVTDSSALVFDSDTDEITDNSTFDVTISESLVLSPDNFTLEGEIISGDDEGPRLLGSKAPSSVGDELYGVGCLVDSDSTECTGTYATPEPGTFATGMTGALGLLALAAWRRSGRVSSC